MTATTSAPTTGAVDDLYRSIRCKITGDSLLLHNGALASPLNPATKAIKIITNKRSKKTDTDVEMLTRLEALGGLYLGRFNKGIGAWEQATAAIRMGDLDFEFGLIARDDDGNELPDAAYEPIRGDQIVMPGLNLEAMIWKGAKKTRKGTDIKSGVMVADCYQIRHKHERRTLGDLLTDHDFVDTRLVVVQRARIARTRPILKRWSIEFEIQYIPSLVNSSTIEQALDDASLSVGLGDFAPRFGKFRVERFEVLR